MSILAPKIVSLFGARDLGLVGGKAKRLADLAAAGIPVPEGFVITTSAFLEKAQTTNADFMSSDLADSVCACYRELGSPPVVVRSSATIEDLEEASMAGQFDSVREVTDEEALVAAIHRCWKSWGNACAAAYTSHNRPGREQGAMAVIVQRQAAARSAGVLFTHNPHHILGEEMLVEASWGLGEAVVSGRVQPDILKIDRKTGAVTSSCLGRKGIAFFPGRSEPEAVESSQQAVFCLSSKDVDALWRMAFRVEAIFGEYQDIEWAISEEGLVVLQTRRMTAVKEAQARAACLETTKRDLERAAESGHGDWVRHNLAESVGHPTPLSWDVIRRFMSGRGGFGRLYRDAGFRPSEAVDREGFLVRIAGRPYMDLSLATELFFQDFPYRYDPEELRRDPDAAQRAPTLAGGTPFRQARIGREIEKIRRRIDDWAGGCDRWLHDEVIPEFRKWVAREKERGLGSLSGEAWVEAWETRERAVLDELAPKVMRPNLIIAERLEAIRGLLREYLWDDDVDEWLQRLAVGLEPDVGVRFSQGLYEVGRGERTLSEWMDELGHRSPEDLELGSWPWREQVQRVLWMAEETASGRRPLDLFEQRRQEAETASALLRNRLKPAARPELDRLIHSLRRYLPWRENAKHELVLGYDLLRDLVREAGRRLGVGDRVVYLRLSELKRAVLTGFAPISRIEENELRQKVEGQILLPRVIERARIGELGQPVEPGSSHGLGISSGQVEGKARVVATIEDAESLQEGEVLVCPSTDPSWTPLFAKARAVVMEQGGVLSHGAIVARELGVPAVVMEGAMTRFESGEMLKVDGHHGRVTRSYTDDLTNDRGESSPADPSIPASSRPPVEGAVEQRGRKACSFALGGWAVLFLLAWLLPPEQLYQPIMRFWDALLLPLAPSIGRVGVVTLVGVGLAIVTLGLQRTLTDNRRLRVVKERADRLRREAAQYAEDSVAKTVRLRLASQAQRRILGASFMPVALFLGPMVFLFLWFPSRFHPANWNPNPGSIAFVKVTVSGEHTQPIKIEPGTGLELDEATPASQSAPPIRSTLERLLARWEKTKSVPNDLPWAVKAAAMKARKAMLADLNDYLKGRMPPQVLTWMLLTPKDHAGRYPVTIKCRDGTAVGFHLVVGNGYSPPRQERSPNGRHQVVPLSDKAGPVQKVRVRYRDPDRQMKAAFFKPLEAVGIEWDFGWLGTYIIIYLPAVLILRRLLRLP